MLAGGATWALFALAVIAVLGDRSSPTYRLSMLLVTLGAFVVASLLCAGGTFLILQAVARLRLRHHGILTCSPTRLLNRGVELRILRRVGSGFRFIHNDVRDRLAEMTPL